MRIKNIADDLQSAISDEKMDEDSDEESDEDSNNDNSDEDSDLDDEAEDSDVSNEAEDEDEDSDVSVSHMLPRSRIARKTIAIMKENHIARHNPHKKRRI